MQPESEERRPYTMKPLQPDMDVQTKRLEIIRKRKVQRLGWVYEPSWCCRNIALSVTGLMNVSQSGCSQRRPSHLLSSFTLPACLLSGKTGSPANESQSSKSVRYARYAHTLLPSGACESVRQQDWWCRRLLGANRGARLDEAWRWQKRRGEEICSGRLGRVAIQDTQWTAPALRGTRSGGGYGCSDNLAALRGIPKKENDVVTSGRGE